MLLTLAALVAPEQEGEDGLLRRELVLRVVRALERAAATLEPRRTPVWVRAAMSATSSALGGGKGWKTSSPSSLRT